MDLSKLKMEAYDLLAVIVPGLLLICEAWVTIRGWNAFAATITAISASALALLILVAFPLGQIIQELGDFAIKHLRGDRFFKSTRDQLWNTTTGQQIRGQIRTESHKDIENVDVAFDYCLTRVQAQFAKRDLFLASSDLARSLVVLCVMALAPAARIAFSIQASQKLHWFMFGSSVVASFATASLCWIRMKRFRALSESPVFHAYLAQSHVSQPNAAAAQK